MQKIFLSEIEFLAALHDVGKMDSYGKGHGPAGAKKYLSDITERIVQDRYSFGDPEEVITCPARNRELLNR